MLTLPIDALLPKIRSTLEQHHRLILEAQPGAGKSTRVPVDLLAAPWLDGRKILLLEPRRIAARNLAVFLASQMHQSLGQTIGLQIRFERKRSPATRLEVLTEGVLTQRLQSDPELADVGLIIFDEFHERNLQTDLGLALALEVQQDLRPDLRLLLMSATLDSARLGSWLSAPVLKAQGRHFPIQIEHQTIASDDPRALARCIGHILERETGDALVFLPGARQIRQTAQLLESSLDPQQVDVRCLHGSLPLEAQRLALSAATDDRRRVVLSTNIAESSLTVPGIRIVIDSGLARAAVFNPESGLTRLQTRRISQASADQRAGRAGRLEAGSVLRLWSAQERLQSAWPAEINSADLMPVVLELALWGTRPDQLQWLDPPPAGALAQARDRLQNLSVLDPEGRPTALASRLGRWGTQPRLAVTLELAGNDLGLAADAAALIESRSPLPRHANSDQLLVRLEWLWQSRRASHRGEPGLHRVDQLVRRWTGKKPGPPRALAAEDLGRVLAPGWPDRVARLRPGHRHRYKLANGKGVTLGPDSELAGSALLLAIELNFDQRESRITLATPLAEQDLMELFAGRLEQQITVHWDARSEAVVAHQEQRFDTLVLRRKRLDSVPPESARPLLEAEIRRRGLASLPWPGHAVLLRQRLAFARLCQGDDHWPAVDDQSLLDCLGLWLANQLTGLSRWSQLQQLDLHSALKQLLDYKQLQKLGSLAPTTITVPSGRQRSIDYSRPEAPVLAVKLQEMFGSKTTPCIGAGRIPLTLHLLSPAGRPLQVTRDLAHFWSNAYVDVRKEMRGRYPKHPWPENPLQAKATSRTKSNRT